MHRAVTPNTAMNITLLSPYHSGSHKSWAEGYAKHSQHNIDLLTMQGRFWKWRMHGGAVTLARLFREHVEVGNPLPDLLIADDMLDVTTFMALTRDLTNAIPFALYMHENQLTYPLPLDPATGAMRRNHNERDHHYVFINYSSMLAADHIYFNSKYHLNSWFEALPTYLRHYPEHREISNVERLREKSSVLPVGVNFTPRERVDSAEKPPLILWNQRWEYDKNPEAFFAALYELADQGVPFRLAVCGENFSRKPVVFEDAAKRLSEQIIQFGFADRDAYQKILAETDLVVSTAVHEFFGISVIEAIAHGACPILPERLSYPEHIPVEFSDRVLYTADSLLVNRLLYFVQHQQEMRDIGRKLAVSVKRYFWQNVAPDYDRQFTDLVDMSTRLDTIDG